MLEIEKFKQMLLHRGHKEHDEVILLLSAPSLYVETTGGGMLKPANKWSALHAKMLSAQKYRTGRAKRQSLLPQTKVPLQVLRIPTSCVTPLQLKPEAKVPQKLPSPFTTPTYKRTIDRG